MNYYNKTNIVKIIYKLYNYIIIKGVGDFEIFLSKFIKECVLKMKLPLAFAQTLDKVYD